MATSRDFVYDDQGEMLPSDSAAAQARRKELGITPKMPARPGQQISGVQAKAKPKVVTKEELAKSGLSLRDYMNKQRGLTRRDGKAPERKSVDSGAASSPKTADKSKGKTASEYSRSSDEMRNLTRQKAAVSTMPSSVYDADTDRMKNKSRAEARFEGAKRTAKTPEAQAKRKAQESGQAVKRVSPEEYIGPAFGLKAASKLAQNLAKPKVKEYNPKMLPAPKAAAKPETKSLPAPQQKLSYDKRSIKDKERSDRAAAREKQKDSDNIQRGGRLTGGRNIELKKGGRVTSSSASKRADGIAVKGKTRGRVY